MQSPNHALFDLVEKMSGLSRADKKALKKKLTGLEKIEFNRLMKTGRKELQKIQSESKQINGHNIANVLNELSDDFRTHLQNEIGDADPDFSPQLKKRTSVALRQILTSNELAERSESIGLLRSSRENSKR